MLKDFKDAQWEMSVHPEWMRTNFGKNPDNTERLYMVVIQHTKEASKAAKKLDMESYIELLEIVIKGATADYKERFEK